jgi:hypothetical protein
MWFLAFDKVLHFVAGLLICLSVGIPTTPRIGQRVATGVGIAKEVVWDSWMGRGTPEFLDFVATWAGSYVGMWWLQLFN